MLRFFFSLWVVLLPAIAFAQGAPTDFKSLVGLILRYIGLLIPLIFGLTFVLFAWGIVQAWILHGGDPHRVEEGHSMALWGVIGLVVMSGLWGIIAILRYSIFGI